MTEIRPLIKQDLISVARELPKMEGLDHEERVLYHFRKKQWYGVDEYVDYVQNYHKVRPVVKPVQPLRAKITSWVAQCTVKLKKWLRGLNLDQVYTFLYVVVAVVVALWIILK